MALHIWMTLKLFADVYLKVIILRIARAIFSAVQSIWWMLSGTRTILTKVSSSSCGTNQCAQRLRVIGCYSIPGCQPSLRDYIYCHMDFIDYHSIVTSKHLNLLFFDDTVNAAVFGEYKNDSQQVANPSRKPQKLISVPMWAFYNMGEGIPEPSTKIIAIGGLSLAGSSLLMEAFNKSGQCITHLEPQPFEYLANMYRRHGNSPEVANVAKCMIKVYCRPVKGTSVPVAHVFFLPPFSCQCMEVFKHIHPNQTVLFYVYEDLNKTALYWYTQSFVQPILRRAYLKNNIQGIWKDYLNTDISNEDDEDFELGDFSQGVFLTVQSIRTYMILTEHGTKIHCIHGDDLVKDPGTGIQAVFQFCGLPNMTSVPALQPATVGISSTPDLIITKSDWITASRILVKAGLLPVDYPFFLPGTINIHTVTAASRITKHMTK